MGERKDTIYMDIQTFRIRVNRSLLYFIRILWNVRSNLGTKNRSIFFSYLTGILQLASKRKESTRRESFPFHVTKMGEKSEEAHPMLFCRAVLKTRKIFLRVATVVVLFGKKIQNTRKTGTVFKYFRLW